LLPLAPRSGERVPRRVSGEAGEGRVRGPQPKLLSKVRRLRRNATDAETKLWYQLKDRRLFGFKFVRQEPIGLFVADFVCRERKLVVEVDGGQHADSRRDAFRDKFLRREGYRVLRVWNIDVLRNREGVLSTILAALGHKLS
jgi:very-short-patch-repair endonuclease